MNELFSKFSLQSFLRQFFCGVVFFTPLYLFAPWCMQNFFSKCGIAMGDSIYYVGALACVIGTIIYHLEKNLYSYVIQGVYEWKTEEKLYPIVGSVGILLVCILMFLEWVKFAKWLQRCLPTCLEQQFCLNYGWILMLIVLAGFLVAKYFLDDKTRETTLTCWKIEGSNPNDNEATKEAMRELKGIAEKVSVWSDFIHCTQSCCFAWILGTYLAYYVLQSCDEGRACSATAASIMSGSIAAAIIILIIESTFIDRHRYAFVELMREKYNRLRSGRIEFSVKIRTMREGEGREEGGRDVGEFHCVVERL